MTYRQNRKLQESAMNREEKKKERSYIPAQPNYYTVELIGLLDRDDNITGYKRYLHPIIGWELTRDADERENADIIVFPVTLEGVDTSNPVVYPDGRVEIPYAADFDSVEEWAQYQLNQRKKEAPEKATATT